MEKYELAVVISAKVEEDVRNDTLAKCKALIERFGGTIGEVEEWGKSASLMKLRSRMKASITSSDLWLRPRYLLKLNHVCVLWKMSSVIFW